MHAHADWAHKHTRAPEHTHIQRRHIIVYDGNRNNLGLIRHFFLQALLLEIKSWLTRSLYLKLDAR